MPSAVYARESAGPPEERNKLTVDIGLELLTTNFTRETSDTGFLIKLAGNGLFVVAE